MQSIHENSVALKLMGANKVINGFREMWGGFFLETIQERFFFFFYLCIYEFIVFQVSLIFIIYGPSSLCNTWSQHQ